MASAPVRDGRSRVVVMGPGSLRENLNSRCGRSFTSSRLLPRTAGVSHANLRPWGGTGYTPKRVIASWTGRGLGTYRVAMRIITRLRHLLRRPFEGAGRSTAFIVTGILIQLVELLVLSLPWIFFVPVELWAINLAVLLPLATLVVAAPALTQAQRSRFRARLDVDIPELTGTQPQRGLSGIIARVRSRAGRRQLRYHLAAGPLLALGGCVALLLWVGAAVTTSVYVWVCALPLDWRLSHVGYSTWAGYVTAGGIAMLCAASWLSGALARLDTRAAMALLGPSKEEQLARRVEDLTVSRAGAGQWLGWHLVRHLGGGRNQDRAPRGGGRHLPDRQHHQGLRRHCGAATCRRAPGGPEHSHPALPARLAPCRIRADHGVPAAEPHQRPAQ
ncbi:hypothetical protein FCI23_13525 [Actinacidiphila oryziradicis]|uniref:Putative sensor domain-containing protein n=1 Tax=Actinacidiphila oryziradicis TaxID=2571141 RepID=A0A4U0SPA3_9ACTN|nr:hypothetical protein FCI23_13525 [Actinacidiphila oryziradicis]